MPAHEVESVAQLAARRVGRVMGKGILVVVDHQPARGAAAHEGIAVVLCGRGVPVGEDIFQHIGDAVRPAERPDDAALGQRVFLRGGCAAHLRFHWLRRRPERGVLPVGVSGEHIVRVKERLVSVSEQILPVLGRAGPVHEPRGFKGRGVEAGKRQVVCDAAGDGRVLVRRDRARERDDEPQAHFLRRVAVRAVEGVGVDERHVQIVQQFPVGIVRVQAHQAAVDHAGAAAFASLFKFFCKSETGCDRIEITREEEYGQEKKERAE